MTTMNKVIEYVDGVKPNAYSDDDKYRWIATLEGMVEREVHQAEHPVQYELPRDADKDLLVDAPYEDIYSLYVSAMIDFYNREYNDYNNTILMFQERLNQYKVWYIQRHPVCKPCNFRNVMG